MSKKVYVLSRDSNIRKILCQTEDFVIFYFSDFDVLCSSIRSDTPQIILLDCYVTIKIGPDCIQELCKVAGTTSVFILSEKQQINFFLFYKTLGIKDILIMPETKEMFLKKIIPTFKELFSIENGIFSDYPQKTELDKLLGTTSNMQKLKANLYHIGRTDIPMLLLGESGTGKTHIAKTIHKLSIRNNNPYYPLNMANIPEQLAEAELFGTVEGAFTGAVRRKGFFSAAEGGTLFMDEIGELPLNIQAKLLHVLEEGYFNKVGTEKQQKCNVRLIFATNKDLDTMIKNKTFREDLYYRISVFPIKIPPLRERKEDIPILANHFLKPHKKFLTDKSLQKLYDYHWPGNIRELKNCLTRASIISKDETIHDHHISF